MTGWKPLVYLCAMLVYRDSGALDREAWDDCVQVAGTLPYGFSWYLDRVCDHWGGLVLDDYSAVFPLPWKRRLGLRWIYPPFFCQQLGVFSRIDSVPVLGEWLQAIPKPFLRIDLPVRGKDDPVLPNWRRSIRPNLTLNLAAGYEQLYAGYDNNTRRNLKKAQKENLQADDQLKSAELVELIRRFQGPKIKVLGVGEYRRIDALMREGITRKRARLVRVFHPEQPEVILAGAYFLEGPGGPVYLFGTSTPEGRINGAMVFLFDRQIRDRAGSSGQKLDFEGSALPGLARFYQGFGAVGEPYQTLHMQRFPLVFKALGR